MCKKMPGAKPRAARKAARSAKPMYAMLPLRKSVPSKGSHRDAASKSENTIQRSGRLARAFLLLHFFIIIIAVACSKAAAFLRFLRVLLLNIRALVWADFSAWFGLFFSSGFFAYFLALQSVSKSCVFACVSNSSVF